MISKEAEMIAQFPDLHTGMARMHTRALTMACIWLQPDERGRQGRRKPYLGLVAKEQCLCA